MGVNGEPTGEKIGEVGGATSSVGKAGPLVFEFGATCADGE